MQVGDKMLRSSKGIECKYLFLSQEGKGAYKRKAFSPTIGQLADVILRKENLSFLIIVSFAFWTWSYIVLQLFFPNHQVLVHKSCI